MTDAQKAEDALFRYWLALAMLPKARADDVVDAVRRLAAEAMAQKLMEHLSGKHG